MIKTYKNIDRAPSCYSKQKPQQVFSPAPKNYGAVTFTKRMVNTLICSKKIPNVFIKLKILINFWTVPKYYGSSVIVT